MSSQIPQTVQGLTTAEKRALLKHVREQIARRRFEQAEADELQRQVEEISKYGPEGWPKLFEYRNAERGKIYRPHHDGELAWVLDNSHRYLLAKGGEGGGKSVAGIMRDLERVKFGASGIMISPDLEHFKKSLWPEFRRWVPWDFVVPNQRRREDPAWEISRPFQMNFTTGAVIYCGGIQESDVMKWEGPNVNWAHFDEGRRHDSPAALKTIDGRVRIPHGSLKPQIWITTTPRKHWLFEYFGPWEKKDEPDPLAAFKRDALVITLLTEDNEENLEKDFARKRRQTLTEREARVLLQAEWEDLEEATRFLESMTWWDALEEDLPALGEREPLVIALDAAVSGDTFGMIGVTRHPDPARRVDSVAVRYVRSWKAEPGKKIDYQGTEDNPGPERELRRLIGRFNVVIVVYDPYQLHDMATRLSRERLAWFEDFGQNVPRLKADKALLDMILARRLAHDGNRDLRNHVDNADKKTDKDHKQLRIVKRSDALPVDLTVCLSMGSERCLYLNL